MKGLILYYSHNNDLKALHQQCYLSKTGCEWVEGCPLSFPVSGDISHGKVWLRSGQRGSSLSFEIANQSSDQARLSSRLQKGVLLTHKAICKGSSPCRWGQCSSLTLLITHWGMERLGGCWGGVGVRERALSNDFREGKPKRKNVHSSLLSWAFANDNNLSSSYF